jgi:putative ABC transport system permease protein
VTTSYQDAYQIYPQIGRFILDGDEQSRRRVCVIGAKLRESLKLPVNPLGTFLEISGEWFKIVGVTEARGEMFGLSQDDYILIPFATGQALEGNRAEQDIAITFTVQHIEQLDAVQSRVTQLLRQLHRLRPGTDDDFKVQTAKQLTESFTQIVNSMTLVLGGVVGISLLVGGIGIMNVMLVSVTERTREIGICKALGAKRHHILMQFLIESSTLAMLGGIAGLLLGYLLGALVSKLIPGFPEAVMPWWAVLLACGFSTVVGVVFGIMPAAKAANLSPIEALRYE